MPVIDYPDKICTRCVRSWSPMSRFAHEHRTVCYAKACRPKLSAAAARARPVVARTPVPVRPARTTVRLPIVVEEAPVPPVDPTLFLTPAELAEKPKVRGDCKSGIRPCPWVSCKHNMYLTVDPGGGMVVNYPGKEPDEMTESCVLDLTDEFPDGVTLDRVGAILERTRERVRQVEYKALRRLSLRERQLGRRDD